MNNSPFRLSWVVFIAALMRIERPRQLHAEEITLTSVADAFLASSEPSQNFGGAGALSVAAAVNPQGEFQSLIRFNTTSLRNQLDSVYGPNQWFVSRATLALTAASPLHPIFNETRAGDFRIQWLQNDSWAEGMGRPNNPGTTGVNYGSLKTLISIQDRSLGVFPFDGGEGDTDSYDLLLDANFTNDVRSGGLVTILLDNADDDISFLFHSRDIGTAAYRPTLTIQAVPEPATLVFSALSLLIGLAANRRGNFGI